MELKFDLKDKTDGVVDKKTKLSDDQINAIKGLIDTDLLGWDKIAQASKARAAGNLAKWTINLGKYYCLTMV
jgi:hypothetical protein